MERIPAPNYLIRARMNWVLQFEPQLTKEKRHNDPEGLKEELAKKAEQAAQYRRKLKAKGNLADDQIDEIVHNMIAPTEGNPPEPLPEEEELEIREWFENQFH